MKRQLCPGAILTVLNLMLSACAVGDDSLPQLQDAWYLSGQEALANRVARPSIPGPARNVILFIGDGMGVATVTAARILEGQRRGESGEENLLSFERLPHVAVAKTYNTDAQTPDSAGAATTMLSGVKTRRGVIGVSGDVVVDDCESGMKHSVRSFLEIAESSGWSTGLITTSRVTDATAAAAYAHGPTDAWEVDTMLPPEAVAAGCTDFAVQLVTQPFGDGPDLILGGGGAHFLPVGTTSPDGRITGKRADGRNLVLEWQSRYDNASVVWSAQALAAEAPNSGPILRLFHASYMSFEKDRAARAPAEPALSEMTVAAIDRLSASGKGYFLLVEGGRIDQAHHIGNAARALGETIELAKAVQLALDRTERSETLVIVTADHDHSMVLAGSAGRGAPIFGLAGDSTDGSGKPYTTILYSTGPSGDGPISDPESRRLGEDG